MKNIIFLLTINIMLFSSCEKMGKYAIIISNKSNHSISVYGQYILPDTSIIQIKPRIEIVGCSGEAGDIFDSDINDEKFERLKSEKLTIFIFNTDTLNKYDWETIRKGYKILKRYELNHDDLAKTNYVVTYP